MTDLKKMSDEEQFKLAISILDAGDGIGRSIILNPSECRILLSRFAEFREKVRELAAWLHDDHLSPDDFKHFDCKVCDVLKKYADKPKRKP